MSIESIDLKFKSGNDVPVTRAEITLEEWEAVKAEIENEKVWGRFVSYLINNHEGEPIDELGFQMALSEMLAKKDNSND